MREMKDSGIEWIGEIPVNWKLAQVRYLFKIGRGRVIAQTELKDDGKYPVFSSQTKNNGCLGYINTYDFDVEQLTWTTDGANAGTVFLRNGKHNCTNVCGTLHPLIKSINLHYQKFALEHIAFYHKRVDTNGYKIMNNEMAAIHTLLPSLEEQQKISTYLDTKCTKIDSIIEKQEKVIEKLKEYKLSVITEAVTKGLNPDVKMKDSGVEWIGEIPEHWEMIRLKFLLTHIVDCPHETPNYFHGGKYHVIRTADQDFGFLRSDDDMYRLDESEYQKRIRRLSLDKDDIVYGREGERWGLACIVPENEKYCLGQRMMQFRCNTMLILPKFAMWALNSRYVYLQGSVDTIGSTSPHVNISTMRNYCVPTPTGKEQTEIMDYLDKKCSAIDKSIEQKQAIIEKLKEYKKSLIYEVVTGKREV